jgi:hypothetical protein
LGEWNSLSPQSLSQAVDDVKHGADVVLASIDACRFQNHICQKYQQIYQNNSHDFSIFELQLEDTPETTGITG